MRKFIYVLLLISLTAACTAEQPEDGAEAHADDAVKIDGAVFSKEDMAFYALMEKIFIEHSRQSADGESDAYWGQQLAQYDNPNVQLQTLIEMQAMSLLAKEKGFYAHPDKVEEHVQSVRALIEEYPPIRQLAEQYSGSFDSELFLYMEKYILKQRIIEELKKTIRAENPAVSERELAFETNERYEDLYEDQMSGLELEIYLK